jgi:hypothetical protein
MQNFDLVTSQFPLQGDNSLSHQVIEKPFINLPKVPSFSRSMSPKHFHTSSASRRAHSRPASPRKFLHMSEDFLFPHINPFFPNFSPPDSESSDQSEEKQSKEKMILSPVEDDSTNSNLFLYSPPEQILSMGSLPPLHDNSIATNDSSDGIKVIEQNLVIQKANRRMSESCRFSSYESYPVMLREAMGINRKSPFLCWKELERQKKLLEEERKALEREKKEFEKKKHEEKKQKEIDINQKNNQAEYEIKKKKEGNSVNVKTELEQLITVSTGGILAFRGKGVSSCYIRKCDNNNNPLGISHVAMVIVASAAEIREVISLSKMGGGLHFRPPSIVRNLETLMENQLKLDQGDGRSAYCIEATIEGVHFSSLPYLIRKYKGKIYYRALNEPLFFDGMQDILERELGKPYTLSPKKLGETLKDGRTIVDTSSQICSQLVATILDHCSVISVENPANTVPSHFMPGDGDILAHKATKCIQALKIGLDDDPCCGCF